eukprot:PhF_6_TR528/c0_g1_i1/m.363/K05305/FUK; fucokinase
MNWDLVAVTAPTIDVASAYVQMLEYRRDLALIPAVSTATKIVAVPDPTGDDVAAVPQGERSIGSGGATLNALLFIAEYLCAEKGGTNLDADIFVPTPRAILILHCRSSCDFPQGVLMGKCFAPIPRQGLSERHHDTNVDSIFRLLGAIQPSVGVWVASTEFTLNIPTTVPPSLVQNAIQSFGKSGSRDITCLTWETTSTWAQQHGTYILESGDKITGLHYKKAPPPSATEPLFLIGPIVKFGLEVAETLLQLHSTSPFDSCSYYRKDAGSDEDVLSINLYLDIIGACVGFKRSENQHSLLVQAHAALLRALSGTQVYGAVLNTRACASFAVQYLRSPEEIIESIRVTPGHQTATSSYVAPSATLHPTCRVINSVVEDNVVIEANAVVINQVLKSKTVVTQDNCTNLPTATTTLDCFKQWAQLRYRVCCLTVREHILAHRNMCVQPELSELVVLCRVLGGNTFHELCEWFDEMLCVLPLPLLGRGLSLMADLLATQAGALGGLRSGPCRNKEWKSAFDSLLHQPEAKIRESILLLSSVRKQWMCTPTFVMRCARHYEGASQVMTQRCVETASKFIVSGPKKAMANIESWVDVHLAARIDVAGGWSDTPPISYEFGGRVINIALLVNNDRPLKCRVRRTNERVVKLVADGTTSQCTLCDDVLREYHVPAAPCALLKAAIVCLGLVPQDADPSADICSIMGLGSGLEIVATSSLPMGSGLGGSSILGAAVVMAIAVAVGASYDADSFVHMVLRLEQLLTTGGGWQDQVGALYKGIKRCESKPELPLQVRVEVIPLKEDFLKRLSQHLVLIFTGRARLARNLLQSVLRRWGARFPTVVETVSGLLDNASEIEQACLKEDIESFGRCLSAYWSQKVEMAGPGAHPGVMTAISQCVRDDIHGCALAGAGGGGFMIMVTKQPNCKDYIWEKLSKEVLPEYRHMTFHPCDIDCEGPQVKFS